METKVEQKIMGLKAHIYDLLESFDYGDCDFQEVGIGLILDIIEATSNSKSHGIEMLDLAKIKLIKSM